MGFSKKGLFVVVMVCMCGRALSAAGDLGEACLDTLACNTPGSHVCDPATKLCKVIADDSATGCGTDDAKCPKYAACATDTCACSAGYTETGGLCTAVGADCTSESICTGKMPNTQCVKALSCTQGTCKCATGYEGSVCQLLAYEKTCAAGINICSTNMECSNLQCKCKSGYTWSSKLGICTDKKLFGQSCTAVGECYANTGSNADCSSTCGCASGYSKDESTELCRKPIYMETCTAAVGCDKVTIRGVLGSESSQQTQTCRAVDGSSNLKCQCASTGETHHTTKIGSTCYNYCLSTFTGTSTTGDGQSCSTHNECASKHCYQCPEDTGGKCVNTPCSNGSGMKKIERGMVLLSFILMLTFMF